MSEFHSGDEVFREGYSGVFKFICGPDICGNSCVEDDTGEFRMFSHKHLKPKPKTITVEIPQPGRVELGISSFIVYFDDPQDASRAYKALINTEGE